MCKAKENGVILGNPYLTEQQELEILKQYQMIIIPIYLIAKRPYNQLL